MKEIEELQTAVSALNDELKTYLEKPTKAKSLRIRNGLGSIKNQTASYRKTLVALDKAGY